jgi:hypothetical protein
MEQNAGGVHCIVFLRGAGRNMSVKKYRVFAVGLFCGKPVHHP